MIRVEGFYFTVNDLVKSVKFYEEILGIKHTHIEGNRWADFYNGDRHFGLLCDEKINSNRKIGNNGVLNFYSDDIKQDFERIKGMGVKIIEELCDTPDSPYEYLCFTFEDFDGNKIEIAWYPI